MDLQQTLTAFLAFARDASCERLCVAYSGGIDSHVLLEQINRLNQGDTKIPLDAVYINHNLQSDSQRWGEHCQQVCLAMAVPFQQIDVNAIPKIGESPEEKARLVRYQALENQLLANQWLVTAQHMDDQAETLLLQLLRGSGAHGLSAMPIKKALGDGELHRPLLTVSKVLIEEYAKQNNLSWIDDPSNDEQTIPRNYLRKTVIPVLEKMWPETIQMLGRSASWLGESAEIMTKIAEQDFLVCQGDYQSLCLEPLKVLSPIRQKNLLRFWFHQRGLRRPGNEKLSLINEQIIHAREDANPQLDWQGISLRRFNKKLFMLPKGIDKDVDWQVSWGADSSVSLVDKIGVLSVSEVSGQGLKKHYQQQKLELRLRKGGEHCHPAERNRSRSLKKLFQEYSVPPWYRDHWPLLYCDNQLIAVPGLFICKGFEAEGSETGLIFSIKL
ncbi:MAG: tRNA lysidine(34) synthetase TilS [Gammaproteobacteria bacterium]|nr:tRNA lysidine(34) synthetase TilS [Gammaproteobacteria bacterium]